MQQNIGCWSIYIIRTYIDTLYTGITNNIERRFYEHMSQGNKCAKYLRGKAPLELVYQKQVGSYSDALKLEVKIKKMSKAQKESLIIDNAKIEL